MLSNKPIKTLLLAFLAVFLAGCAARTEIVYKCPFGVGYLTELDYQTMQSPDLISQQFISWLLMTNEYCVGGEQ